MQKSNRYNDRAARQAQPVDGKRTRFYVDGKPGLILTVSPATPDPHRCYYVRYQIGKGVTRRQGYDAIGDARHWTIGQAWDHAAKVIREAKNGADPKQKRQAKVAADDAAERTVEWCFKTWLETPTRKRTLAARSREEYERLFRLHIAPHFGSLAIVELNSQKIEFLLEETRKATTDAAKGNRGLQATKVRTLLMSVCRFSVKRRWIPHNPVEAVDIPVPQQHPSGKQFRPPTDAELRTIWHRAEDVMSLSTPE